MDRTPHRVSTPEQNRSVNWGYLIVGLLFVAAAVLSFVKPGGSLEAIAFAFAFVAIIGGVWLLAVNLGSIVRIVGGIIDILIGIFMLANVYYTMLALPFVFAVWFIIDSVVRLVNIGFTRTLGPGYFYLSLVFNILGVIVGILLLLHPVTAVFTLSFLVGFYLMLAGVELLALAFQR